MPGNIVIADTPAIDYANVSTALFLDGHRPVRASDGPAVLRLSRAGAALAIVDLDLERLDGFSVLKALKRENEALPIIVVTARDAEPDRLLAFELGADDVVSAPFSVRELAYRVLALARRTSPQGSHRPVRLRFGRLEIDEAARDAFLDGVAMGLRPREFALLLHLARNAGTALSRQNLVEGVWGTAYGGTDRTVDGHVRQIRAKFEECDRNSDWVQTVYGYGYRFKPA